MSSDVADDPGVRSTPYIITKLLSLEPLACEMMNFQIKIAITFLSYHLKI